MTDSNKIITNSKANALEVELKKFAPVQMTFWHDEVRAIANELTRCALISCRSGGEPRRHFNNERLFTLGKDASVTYTGEELRGNDEDNFLALVHLVREMPGGQLVVKVKSSDICKLNGWQTKQSYYTEIYKSILRLGATTLVVMSRRLTKMLIYERARKAGKASKEELARLHDEIHALTDSDLEATDVTGLTMSMVGSNVVFSGSKGVVDDIPQGDLTWEIPMDKAMVTLFAKEWLTLVPIYSRRKLSTAARRLQAYFMSHREPFDVRVSTLGQLLQLDCEIKEQKRIVKKRLQELVDQGVLKSADMSKGLGDVLVRVVRSTWGGVENETPATPDKPGKSRENDPPGRENDPPATGR